MNIFFSSFRFQVGSGAGPGIFFQLSRIQIRGKKCLILIPARHPRPLNQVRFKIQYPVGRIFQFVLVMLLHFSLNIRSFLKVAYPLDLIPGPILVGTHPAVMLPQSQISINLENMESVLCVLVTHFIKLLTIQNG